jgi:serine phosphatase RsbU (regulator of sigma subunit)
MAELKGIFQALIQMDLSTRDFMIKTNTALNNCLEKNLFITLSYFYIDTAKQQIMYSRAGHCPVLYFDAQQGESRYLEDDGIGLGIIRTSQFEEHVHVSEMSYQKDDVILLYSDGIVEQRKEGGTEEYGYDNLKEVLDENRSKDAEEIKNAILESVISFSGDSEQMDDITLVVLKFT